MKTTQNPSPVRSASLHNLKSICRLFAQSLAAIAFAALLLLGGARSGRANSQMVIGIYLYTSSGTIDVTATYSCYDNHVYDPDGHLVGVVDAYNQIEDANNKAVGYVGSGIGNP